MIYDLLCLPIGKSGAKVRFLFEIAMLFDRYFVPVKRITGKMSFSLLLPAVWHTENEDCLAGNPRSVCAVAAELWLQFIAFLPEPLCPLRVGLGLVEVLVGDGLAYVFLEVLATGGLSKEVISHCKTNIIYNENLLLEGLRVIYEKNK